MKEEKFLEQIEQRLEENKQVVASSPLPRILQPLAAYLGFHTFKVLFLTSLLMTLGMYVWFRSGLELANNWLFGI